MKRNIKYIVVHCTATVTTATVEGIKNYWKHHLGWTHNGYHYIILRDGTVENITPEAEIANGVAGFNSIFNSHVLHRWNRCKRSSTG